MVPLRSNLAALAVGLALAAQGARAADTNAILNGWLSAQTNLHTWTAEFTQTRMLKVLTQPLVATGQVWFAVPNKFRWEMRSPSRTVALREADQLLVIYPQLKRAERYPLTASTPAEWREALSLLEAGFPHDRVEFQARFRVLALVETNGIWQFTLQPTSAAARRMMTEIRVGVATNDFALASNELVFIDGSRMRNEFTNAVLNAPSDASLFEWKPPVDFKVTEPLGK